MNQPPQYLLPLLAVAADPSTTVAAFREALKTRKRGSLKNNGHHIVPAICRTDDLAQYVMKFASFHEAIGSEPIVYFSLIGSWFADSRNEMRWMSDTEACQVIRFFLDNKLMEPYPGLFYIACRTGWRECAKMLYKEGLYHPGAYAHFVSDVERQEANLVNLLLEIARPCAGDLVIIKEGLVKDGVGAAMIDEEIERQAMLQ